jgi:two-component system chemotaxis response regulator CheB
MRSVRVLVVDDSAFNRRTLAELLAGMPGVEVVGKAADGDEALRLAFDLEPDLVTLDLEMPRMDGFTFLRLLMSRRPTPVIVVSGYSEKENVFRALELGALDFVAKPARTVTGDLGTIRDDLAAKVALVRALSPARAAQPGFPRFGLRGPGESTATGVFPAVGARPVARGGDATPTWLVGIASSTGGPTALIELFARMPATAPAAILVAQHMPERFTRTFAERLDRITPFRVSEAGDVTLLRSGMALVCPGGRCLEVVRRGADFLAKAVPPAASDRYAPSGDRLLESIARAAGRQGIGVVLTGMGDDGAQGALALRRSGGLVFAESAETAVVYGMPAAAQRLGGVDRSLPLGQLIDALVQTIAG